jgi:putative SOS response-associated peptidase YedK
MCGRFVEFSNIEQLKLYFPIDKVLCEVTANYNAAPTQEILAVFRQKDMNVLEKFHWGLVPHWAKDISTGYKMINARMETIASKPSFRNAFKKRRCLIPSDGFYEWTGKKGNKEPLFITQPNNKPFAFAGLWETWGGKDNRDDTYRSCTIITRKASGSLRDIHHRMPAVLYPDVYEIWLDNDNHEPKDLMEILSEKTITDFKFRPVSKQVNSVKVNDVSNIFSIQTTGKYPNLSD